MSNERRRVHAILGMHRSGTSWLAGSLQEKGLTLGDVSLFNPHNVRGNREVREIARLHEQVLRDNRGSWRKPNWPNAWWPERRQALADYIAGMSARHDTWGFKDPRALLVLDEWQRQVDDLRFVGIFRHPRAVARSLAKRNRFRKRVSYRLWNVYNERLVEEHRRSPFPLLHFDPASESLQAQVDLVAREWGLPNAEETSTFFDDTLAASAGEADVPRDCRALWDYLSEHSIRCPR